MAHDTSKSLVKLEISSPLLAAGGTLNPGIYTYIRHRFEAKTRGIRYRQPLDFDGGWRWYFSDPLDAYVIYNALLHRRANAEITSLELENSPCAEITLKAAKVRAWVDSQAFQGLEQVIAHLRTITSLAIREIQAGVAA